MVEREFLGREVTSDELWDLCWAERCGYVVGF